MAESGCRAFSLFGTYYSIVPEDLFLSSGGTPQRNEERVGGSATVEYARFSERSALSIAYSPSYVGGIRYSGWNAANHALFLNWRRKVNERWGYAIFVSAVATLANEVLFTPTTLASTAAAPASFDDLVSAILAGKSNNDQLASILAGGSVLESPAAMLIYGDRVFTSQVQVGATYSHSSRLFMQFRGAATRTQFLKGGAGPAGVSYGYIVPQTSSGSASVGIGYSLSPRTQVGLDASTTRTMSRVQDAYRNSVNASVGHVMGRRWFAQARGGLGFVTAVRRTYDLPGGVQYQVGGDIGYKTYAHTLMASGMRSAGDYYGFGANSSISATGAWYWSRPGSAWWAASSFGEEALMGTGFPTFTSWRATTGIGRRLGGHVAVFAQYGYIDYSGLTGRVSKPIHQHVGRLAIVWTPSGAIAR